MEKTEANLLSEIHVNEVSLVDKGANKRKYLLLKADQGDQPNSKTPDDTSIDKGVSNLPEEINMNEEILKAAAEVELSEDDIKAAVEKAKLSEKGAEAAKTVLRVLKAASEDLPTEFYTDIVKLAGGELPVKEVEKIVEVEKKSKEEKAEELKKEALANLPAEQRAVIEQSLKISKEAQESAKKATEELKKAREEKELAELTEVVKKEYGKLPEKPETFAAVLYKAKNALSKEEYEELTRVLKAGNESVSRSEDFEKVGSGFSGGSGGTSKLEKLTKELVKKARSEGRELTEEKAMDLILRDNPDLYYEDNTSGGVN